MGQCLSKEPEPATPAGCTGVAAAAVGASKSPSKEVPQDTEETPTSQQPVPGNETLKPAVEPSAISETGVPVKEQQIDVVVKEGDKVVPMAFLADKHKAADEHKAAEMACTSQLDPGSSSAQQSLVSLAGFVPKESLALVEFHSHANVLQDYTPCLEALADLIIGKPVGSGGFATVYTGLWHGTTDVAVKICNTAKDKVTDDPQYLREAVLSVGLSHPHIIKTHAVRCCKMTREFLDLCFPEHARAQQRSQAAVQKIPALNFLTPANMVGGQPVANGAHGAQTAPEGPSSPKNGEGAANGSALTKGEAGEQENGAVGGAKGRPPVGEVKQKEGEEEAGEKEGEVLGMNLQNKHLQEQQKLADEEEYVEEVPQDLFTNGEEERGSHRAPPKAGEAAGAGGSPGGAGVAGGVNNGHGKAGAKDVAQQGNLKAGGGGSMDVRALENKEGVNPSPDVMPARRACSILPPTVKEMQEQGKMFAADVSYKSKEAQKQSFLLTSPVTGGLTPLTPQQAPSHHTASASSDGFGRMQAVGGRATSWAEIISQLKSTVGDVITIYIMDVARMGSLWYAIEAGVFDTRFSINGLEVDRSARRLHLRALIHTAKEVAMGLAFLHKQKVVHGDVKPANVLLNESRADARGFSAAVGDFGLSKLLVGSQYTSDRVNGTTAYLAPELIAHGRVTYAVDIYAFGISLWEMVTGQHAYEGMRTAQVLLMVHSQVLRPPWPDYCPELRSVFERCVLGDPAQRPTCEELCEKLTALEKSVRQQGKKEKAEGLGYRSSNNMARGPKGA